MTRMNWKSEFDSLLAQDALQGNDRQVIESMHARWRAKGTMTRNQKNYFNNIKERTATNALRSAERAASGPTQLGERLSAVNEHIVDRSCWAAGFIESLIKQELAGRELSQSQTYHLSKIEKEHTAEKAALAKTFTEDFANNKDNVKTKWIQAITYYKHDRQYHVVAVRRWFDFHQDPDYTTYRRIVENKYAQKVIAGYDAAPKFSVGSRVKARANAPYADLIRLSKGGFIVNSTATITSAAVGNKTYTVLPVGAGVPVEIEERHLKHWK